MRWLDIARFLLRPFRSRTTVHDELDDEVRFHLEMETEKLIEKGFSPDEARRTARMTFGNAERIKEEVREVDGVSWMEKLTADARFGLRVLRRNPVFAGVGILTLALGIGASTAIFSVVDGILLRPLPYPEPSRLVTVWADFSPNGGPDQEWLSYPNYQDARALPVFDELSAFQEWRPTLSGQGEPEMLRGAQVAEGMFSRVLRVRPFLGRTFAPEDDLPDASPVVLLSHGYWVRNFGADEAVLGSTIVLDGIPSQVVGVMPPGFNAPLLGGDFAPGPPVQDIWGTLRIDLAGPGGGRGSIFLRTVGRLGQGVTVEAAQGELRRLGSQLEQEYPETNVGKTYSILPLHQDMVQGARTGLWVLLGSVGFVLLLVCLNLANLVLARGSARTGEMALRSAMGANRGRLVRQLVTESTVMAVLGGGLGLVVAYWATDLLVSLAPEGTPRIENVVVGARIVAFGILAALGAGILFGLFPALRMSGVDLRTGLSQSGRGGSSGGGLRLRSLMVAGQMAVAVVLLVGAGLLLRSFRELHRVDLGFEPQGVLAAFLTMNPDRYPEAEHRTTFADGLEARLSALPGVESVGFSSTLPMSGFNGDTDFQIQGLPPPVPGQKTTSWFRRVNAAYFEAMGIPVLEGRAFSPADNRDTDARVVIVNETLARRYFPGASPIGQRLNFNDPENPVWREIVGVARDVKNFGVRAESQNATYFPYAQSPVNNLFLAVSTSLDNPSALLPAVRREVAEMDPQIALYQPTTVAEMVEGSLAQDRFLAFLLSLFAGVALLLAAVGLYGVVAYGVARRLNEIGLRVALGAPGGLVGRLVVVRSLRLVAVGMVAGILAALALTRLLSGLLFGVQPLDPASFGVTLLALVGVALAASAFPAWRASRVDPAEILKAE
jgi:predicted permease